jgi:hypothetical protein
MMMWRRACVSLDVADWHSEDEYIEVQHRPDASIRTPLKLKQEGERYLSIFDADISEAMDDYISHNRISHTEADGREPLFIIVVTHP